MPTKGKGKVKEEEKEKVVKKTSSSSKCPIDGCGKDAKESSHPTISHLKIVMCPVHGATNITK